MPQPGQQKARTKDPQCLPDFAVVVNGHCWIQVQHSPGVCPKGTVPYGDACLAPVAEKSRPPTSIQGTP